MKRGLPHPRWRLAKYTPLSPPAFLISRYPEASVHFSYHPLGLSSPLLPGLSEGSLVLPPFRLLPRAVPLWTVMCVNADDRWPFPSRGCSGLVSVGVRTVVSLFLLLSPVLLALMTSVLKTRLLETRLSSGRHLEIRPSCSNVIRFPNLGHSPVFRVLTGFVPQPESFFPLTEEIAFYFKHFFLLYLKASIH